MGDDDDPPFPSCDSSLQDLMLQLSSNEIDDERSAAMEFRELAKTSSANRVCIAQIGAIPRLIELLTSPDKETQTHAITALFNLTLRNDSNKVAIAARGMEAVVNVLLKGSMEGRENAAALVCNLSKAQTCRAMADMEDVYTGLVGVLRDGSYRGKRDAAAAMYNLMLMSKKSSVDMAVRARAVDALLHIAHDSSAGLVDESLALLTHLSGHHHDARSELRCPFSLQSLLGLLKDGSPPPTKESACALLLLLCRHSSSASSTLLMLGALDPLSALTQCGTDRARRKAITLLELL